MTRRGFLKKAGVGLASVGATTGAIFGLSKEEEDEDKGLLATPTKEKNKEIALLGEIPLIAVIKMEVT